MNIQELQAQCLCIRRTLLHVIEKNGGHLASNLGSVELTVALHQVFDFSVDSLVWDVGHQAYTHKILTRAGFETLRQEGGISGFPKRSEGDCFISGHSSTSICAASGIAHAHRMHGQDVHTIAVIGDGAMTGGMAYEGLLNAGLLGDKLIIVLNDNEHSISKNVGGMAEYLTKLRMSEKYFKSKDAVKNALAKIPLIGKGMVKAISKSKATLRNLLYNDTFFDEMGYVYLGPVDGHDLKKLIDVLQRAKQLAKPVVLHIRTQKGKGCSLAESNKELYHSAPPCFYECKPKQPCYSDVFGETLVALAQERPEVCAITAAMCAGTGLNLFHERFADRYFDVGIAEQYAITFGAGLAVTGMTPVFAVYSTFLQRAFDQLIHDCSIEPVHLVLGIDRAGIVGDDGETHQGVFDVSMLSAIPGAVIYSPSNFAELSHFLRVAVTEHTGLVAVRYPRGNDQCALQTLQNYALIPSARGASATLVLSYGRICAAVCQAIEQAQAQMPCDFLKLVKIYPIEQETLAIARNYQHVLFFEEGIESGGIAQKFGAKLLMAGFSGSFATHTLGDCFIAQATVSNALKKYGLDAQSIAQTLLDAQNANIAQRQEFS